MRITRTKAVAAGFALALTMAGCGGNAGEEEGGAEVDVADNAAEEFKDGTRMRELAEQGTVKIGVKFDQPGLGFKDAASDVPAGFDVEMGKVLAASLGIDEDKVEWIETISDNREPFLQNGTVDLVLATYSITDERRAVVGQAGPYMVTGQQLLVKEDSSVAGPDDLQGKEVCTVTGSTPFDRLKEKGMKPVGFDTYSECVPKVLDGTVEAMSTDGSILQGYAAQNEGQLKVVGDPFSEERIGVGYAKDKPEMCQWIVDTVKEAQDDGAWADAFEATLGKSGAETPEPPAMDACS